MPLIATLMESPRVLPALGKWQIAGFTLLAFVLFKAYRVYSTYMNIPTVGTPPGLFGRLKAPYRWTSKGSMDILCEGVAKYAPAGKPFKVATFRRWLVFVTSPASISELKSLSDSVGNTRKFIDELFASDYTYHRDIFTDAVHVDIIRKKIVGRMNASLPSVVEELTNTWEYKSGISPDWKPVNVFSIVVEAVARTTSRVFVGVPLCHNRVYLDAIEEYSKDTIHCAIALDRWPSFLQPIVSKFIVKRDKTLKAIIQIVRPVFEARREKIRAYSQHGDAGAEEPEEDAFTWIIQAMPPDTPMHLLVARLMLLGAVSIHTTATLLTHTIYDLAANPEFQQPLREELETMFREEGGWTKNGITKLKKMDSVVKESLRLGGVVMGSAAHTMVRPHTFSDGTFVSAGCWVAVPSAALHRSDLFYENAEKYDGLRSWRKRQEHEKALKYQLGTIWSGNDDSEDYYFGFGTGPRACPGRFFAGNEVKIALGHILSNYEFGFLEGQGRPENLFFGWDGPLPDSTAVMRFRKRVG